MTDMKESVAFTAAGARPGISSGASAVSQIDMPTVFAYESMRPWLVWPIPRLGELTMREKETVSRGFTSRVR